MLNKRQVLQVLDAHVQSARNKRCECGWRPTWPDDRIGAEYYQHREHLAEVLAAAFGDDDEPQDRWSIIETADPPEP